ncbi:membrane protein [Formosimonas limnophila]|uniref:Membrane protein n=1 Tax=Formosimonas limnophila TaxID=1384487 RepID=A0A8J3G0N0_9BURK|nr:DoxX family protein [Formosimonas limnophila]GHA76815.1 membrane protein [Formosimonas limnophila]
MSSQVLNILGRVLIAALFIPAGLSKITGFEGTVDYIASQGLPLPTVAAILAIVVEVGVAAALLFNVKTYWAALILAVFCIVSALGFHQFWAAPAEMAQMQQINFFKNLAIAGGLFLLAANSCTTVRASK